MRRRRGFDIAQACAQLAQADHRLAPWIERLGPLPAEPRWRQSFDLTDALARSILHQQLSGKAAATIIGRIEAATGSARLDAAALAGLDDAGLRACGVSANKQAALRDLCRRSDAGQLPDARRMSSMDDEAIVAALTPVRGIGRWTVEMLLMFRLGRPDVLPIDDLGIRRGAQRIDRLAQPPTRQQLAERGQCWAPFRTCASFYLWRIADLVGD